MPRKIDRMQTSRPLILPRPLQARLDAAVHDFVQGDARFDADFLSPAGEPAFTDPDSISWQVFKNPLSLFVGGIAAVILELAEPRVRAGVWEHTAFRDDPLQRIRRTGLSAMMTVYGARSRAERMIARVAAMHARVSGTADDGRPYRADDPELLNWVHATARFGFLEAYAAWVDTPDAIARARFHHEGIVTARLYGAHGAPATQQEQDLLFMAMRDQLEASSVIFEFLDIVRRVNLLPSAIGGLQELLVKAAIDILPEWVRERLDLGSPWDLKTWQRLALRRAGAAIDRIPLRSAPAAQACRRVGLPEDFLYTTRPWH
ncbi:oxygenase MpaB family protein [Noviherbaspirillum denitrificans]|uniref:oxygenase MpaB family protein n=1 Tax=Noviherbaspirillum denitrificans TaxID=1968433 RepID=UPI001F2BAA19|nr:oxygenase MpaB family protein [Noviherbaspirillum denitrificans]